MKGAREWGSRGSWSVFFLDAAEPLNLLLICSYVFLGSILGVECIDETYNIYI